MTSKTFKDFQGLQGLSITFKDFQGFQGLSRTSRTFKAFQGPRFHSWWGSEKVPGQLQLCVLHCWGVLFKRGRHSLAKDLTCKVLFYQLTTAPELPVTTTVCISGSLYRNGSFRSSPVTKMFTELFFCNFWGADQTKITYPIYSATILNKNWDSLNWKIRENDI